MSHIISKIRIENFKSIISEDFEFSEFTPLVGYNNAGKTNILEAIKWVLRKISLNISCFNNPANPIIMTATIEGISEDILENINETHRARIEPYLYDQRLIIRRTQNEPSESVSRIRLEVLERNNNGDETQWKNNPAGIDNAIKDLFPEPIHIGAMENSEEDVSKSKSSTTIGKLLAEIIGPIEEEYGDNVRDALNGLRDILDADGEQRAQELIEFDRDVNEKLDSFFPDINVRVHVPTPVLQEVFTKGTIRVYENGLPNGSDVSLLGHGAQRSIQMTLIRHLADIKNSDENFTSTTLLLIDEPELYLHPQAIEILRLSLKNLSRQGYQVIFSTHSPFTITQKDVENTILVRKNNELGTYKRRTLKSAVPQIEQDAQSQLTLLYSLSNSSNILFSEKVILAEGKTENRLIPHLIEKITNRTLSLHKCALVQQGGGGNTRKSMLVLSTMDLPNKAIVDLDFALKNGISEGYLFENDPDILACHSEMAILALEENINLGNDGWPTKTNSQMTAADAFALLAQRTAILENINNILQKFRTQNIWVWKKGTIEKHLDLDGKTEGIWASFIAQLSENDFENLLPHDFEEISECIHWVLN